MVNWDEITDAENHYLSSRKDSSSFKQLESVVKEYIDKVDAWITAWDHSDVHQLRAIWGSARKLTIYARQRGLDCSSVYDQSPLPTEPFPENLKNEILAMDSEGNCLMNDSAQSIKYGIHRR